MLVDLAAYGYEGYWMNLSTNRIVSDYPRVLQTSNYRVKCDDMYIDGDNYHTIYPNRNGMVYLYVGEPKLEKVDFYKLKVIVLRDKKS